MKVNSVNGPIDTKDIGRTLIHEHLASVDLSMINAFLIGSVKKKCIRNFVKGLSA
jgi:predicted metal-dependent phosphotriesterase family hydrolase